MTGFGCGKEEPQKDPLAKSMVILRPNTEHGEVCALYLCGFLSIVLCGPGRFSIDPLSSPRS